MAVKMVGGGVGLGREAYLNHKEKKQAAREQQEFHQDQSARAVDAPQHHQHNNDNGGHAVCITEEERACLEGQEDSDSDDGIGHRDEEIWELDEASKLAPLPTYQEAVRGPEGAGSSSSSSSILSYNYQPVEKLVATVIATNATPAPHPSQIVPLRYPVVLPQRRPRSKARGFVRAYAPDLAASGIPEQTFLHFLQKFDEAAKASPYFQTIFIAAGVVGFIPGAITQAVSISVQFAAGTAIELQKRYRANAYLDQINRELFMPRGLYVMVMRFKPNPRIPGLQAEVGFEEVNLQAAQMATTKSVARWAPATSTGEESGPPSQGMKVVGNIRIASGSTQGEENMPLTVAQLVFPGLKNTVTPQQQTDSSEKAGFVSKMKSAQAFIDNYYDRRSQAEYNAQNPNSTLGQQVEAPAFRSRFADPTSAANTGSLVGLVTGGHIQFTRRARRRARRQLRRAERNIAEGRAPDAARGPVGLIFKGVEKILTEDVLYMMVVNLPSQEELGQARYLLEQNGWLK
jgi:hypothetical protein